MDRRWLLVAALVAAFNLRLAIAAPGPVIDTIRADTAMSSGLAGVLITIPFVCMSAFAFAGPPLIRRAAPYGVVLLSLSLIGAGTLARAVAPTPAFLIGATVPIGIGIALMGVALPVVVKQRFVHHSGAVTGAYVSALSAGVFVIGVGIVPLADLIGGWRPAFAISAAPAVVAIVMWFAVHSGIRAPSGSDRRPASSLAPPAGAFRPGRVEVLAAASFGLQSMCYAGLVGWIAAIYIEVGWSPAAAALTTASLGLFVIPGSLIVPSLSQGKDRRPWIAVTVAVMAVGVLGIAVAPGAAAPLWLAAFGLGGGAAFALQLALPIDLRSTALGVAHLTAWMLGLGYVLSAAAPILVGVLRDVTGGFVVPMTLLGSLALLGIVVAFMLPPPLHRAPEPAAYPPVGPH